MTTHEVSLYVDGKGRLRGRCGAIVDPNDTGQPDRTVDCMTCLVHEARRTANQNGDIVGRVVSINPDGTANIETTGTHLWR